MSQSFNQIFAHTRTADENILVRRIFNRVSLQTIVSAKKLDKRRLKYRQSKTELYHFIVKFDLAIFWSFSGKIDRKGAPWKRGEQDNSTTP